MKGVLTNTQKRYLLNSELTMYQLPFIKHNKLLHLTNYDDDNNTKIPYIRKAFRTFDPVDFEKLDKNITHLEIHSNLKEIPDFNIFKNLRYLDLHTNKLTEIKDINLPNLEVLDLTGNNLKSLPNIICPNLISLKVGYNKLTSLPKFNFPKLINLNASGNNFGISGASRSASLFVNYPKLKVLELGKCKLNTLPDLPRSLIQLDVYGNKLTSFSEKSLDKLEHLYISDNDFTSIELHSPSLKHILMNNCVHYDKKCLKTNKNDIYSESTDYCSFVKIFCKNLLTLECLDNDIADLEIRAPNLKMLDLRFSEIWDLVIDTPDVRSLHLLKVEFRNGPALTIEYLTEQYKRLKFLDIRDSELINRRSFKGK